MWNQLQIIFSNEDDSRLDNLDETFTSFCRTPLHIAAMSGDIKFATKILSKPEGPNLALKQDSNGFTPLHLASVRTSLPMVRLLLEAKPDACIVQDEDGRTPLHLAAMKNRVEVMKVLMEEGIPGAIHLKNDQNGETILHLCVRSNSNLKTLKLLVKKLVFAPLPDPNPSPILINSTDNNGNTILHLAAEMGNMKVTNYLLLNNNVRVDINLVNNKGLKSLNMLLHSEKNDLQFGFYGYHVRHDKHKSKTLFKSGEGLKDRVNALMVVATLIAGISFQAAMNPPGGVWQDDSKVNSSTDPVTFAYYLDNMFGSSISSELDRYIQDNLQYPAKRKPNYWTFRHSNTIRVEEEDGAYRTIERLVMNLRSVFVNDIYYNQMTRKGLILEDFMFTDVVSYYNNMTINSSRGGFFPYLIRYAGYPVLAYTCPDNYMIYMVSNGVAFVVSLTIISLVICGFMTETSVTQVRILVVLMCISIGCMASSYLSILEVMVPEFFDGVFLHLYLLIDVFFGVCCILVVGLFIWSLTWKIVKLRKRTRQHPIGVINYLTALFFSMDASAAGKLILFIVTFICLMGYAINGVYYNYV
ncbi:hypothetical protein MKX01_035863 [Papaver californicum]|nr:hypothetical protein MKX01_035863 [Papaver californicum]